MRSLGITLFLASLLASQFPPPVTPNAGPNTSLRGISASRTKKAQVLWTTGSNGVILRSSDVGKSWSRLHIDKSDTQDLRGVQSFGADVAYVFSVGTENKSHIYKTTNAGKTWRTQYSDPRLAFFLDGLVCRSEKDCFAISDPIDGKFPVLHTTDGELWTELPKDTEPSALPTEGLFAASNTSLIMCGPNQTDVLFATGGPAARVFRSTDNAQTWSVVTTPILSGNATAGIFSLACDGSTVVAVGGDYRNPTATKSVAAFSTDLGATWHLSDQPPAGYRSGVTSVAPQKWVAVGTTGTDISDDGGVHWTPLNQANSNAALTIGSGLVLTVGPKGDMTQIRFGKHANP